MAAAYRELPWSLLSSTPENEEALSLHPNLWRDVKLSVPGTWFTLASDYFQALTSHHNGGKPNICMIKYTYQPYRTNYHREQAKIS